MANVHYDEFPTELIYRKKPVLTVEEQREKLMKKVKKADVDLVDQVNRRNRYAKELRNFNKAYGFNPDPESSVVSSIKREKAEKKSILKSLQLLGPDGSDLLSAFQSRRKQFKQVFDGISLKIDPYNKTLNVALNTKEVPKD